MKRAMKSKESCLRLEILESLFSQKASRQTRTQGEEHLIRCESCRELLADLYRNPTLRALGRDSTS